MQTKSPIVVIGAGIVGASAAYFLSSWGNDVTLIEREHPASGPTGRSSAVLHAFYLLPELSLLGGRGVDYLHRIPELTGEPAAMRTIGTLWASGPSTAEKYRERVEDIRAQGFEIESVEIDGLRRMAPEFNWDGVEMAVWEPRCGYADPYGATNAFVAGARRHGAKVRQNTRVETIDVEKGRVRGVRTTSGEVIAADIVLAITGIWTKPLLAKVGCDLPLTMERHPHAVMEAPGLARQVMPFAWVDDTKVNYGRPEGENTIILGANHIPMSEDVDEADLHGNLADDPENFKEGVDTAEAIAIIETFLPRIPKLESLGIRPGYACLYDMSADGNPIIDAVPGVDGLFTACGSSGHGFKSAPAVGECVARLALGDRDKVLDPFTIGRFSK